MAHVRGKVTAKQIVEMSDPIVWATANNGALHYLVHTHEAFFREGQQRVFSGQRRPHTAFRLLPDKTLVGQGNQLVIIGRDGRLERLQVDTCDGLPVFDTNGPTYFWVQDGQLMRAGPPGPERIGEVFTDQTRIWIGATLGFGFYRAGDLHVAFVFDPNCRGINDSVRLPAMRGQLVDVTCKLAHDRAWLIWCTKESGRIMHHAAVILSSGEVMATLSEPADTGTWMASAHGALAIGRLLLVPADDGIVRVDTQQRQIVLSKTFPDTESYVDAASRLLAGPGGVYVVRGRTIHLLSINED